MNQVSFALSLTVAFLIATVTQHTVNSLSQCYYCSDDSYCANSDNASKWDIVNCTSDFTLLEPQDIFPNKSGITCGKISVPYPNITKVTRACFYKYFDGEGVCDYLAGLYNDSVGITIDCQTCDTDLCNRL